MAFWDALRTEQGTGWNPTPGPGQRNDYSIPLPVGTQIVAPVSGIVLPQNTAGNGLYSYYGRQRWGGEVDILTSMPDYPGTLQNVNVLHFDTINVKPGDQVIAGQTVLGTSGGQTSGGNMPSSPIDSTGPHIGVGVHSVPSWNAMYNPATLISNLLAGRNVSAAPAQSQLQGSGLGWLPRGGVPSATGVPLAAGNWPGVPNQIPPGSPAPSSGDPLCDMPIFGGLLCMLRSQVGRALKLGFGVLLLMTGAGLFIASVFAPDVGAAAITAAGVPEAAPAVQRALSRNKVSGSIKAGVRAKGEIEGQKTIRKAHMQGAIEEAKIVDRFFRTSGAKGGKKAAANRKARQGKGIEGPERSNLSAEEAKKYDELEARNAQRKAALSQFSEAQLAAMSPEERARALRSETRKNLGE